MQNFGFLMSRLICISRVIYDRAHLRTWICRNCKLYSKKFYFLHSWLGHCKNCKNCVCMSKLLEAICWKTWDQYFWPTCFQEAKELLAGASPDADAMTRGQQKKIEEIQAEKPSPKKAKMSKQGTMAATAKVWSEPQCEKTNNLDSNHVWHKPSCTATGDFVSRK